MRLKLAIGLAAGALFVASPATGQDYRGSAGWYGGVLNVGSLNAGVGAPSVDLKPGVSPTFGLHADRWFGGGFLGARLNLAWAQQNLEWSNGERQIYTYAGDLAAMLRIVPPSPGRRASLYATGGVGLIRYGLGEGPRTEYQDALAEYGGSEEWNVTVVGGLGFDIISPWNWGEGPIVFRLEGADLIQLESPLTATGDESFDLVHSIRVTAGLHTGIGFLGR